MWTDSSRVPTEPSGGEKGRGVRLLERRTLWRSEVSMRGERWNSRRKLEPSTGLSELINFIYCVTVLVISQRRSEQEGMMSEAHGALSCFLG